MKTNRTKKQFSHNREPAQRITVDTAILSERVLAREWLKPEEDSAWDYL